MKIVLRLIALSVAALTLLTAVHFFSLASRAALTPLVKSGSLGAFSVLNWLVVMLVGPFAAVQLWRLRRSGRLAAVFLCACAIAYHLYGLSWWLSPGMPVGPVYESLAWNGALLGFLLSPAARRAA